MEFKCYNCGFSKEIKDYNKELPLKDINIYCDKCMKELLIH